MFSSELHNFGKLHELERIEGLLDQISSVQRPFDISEIQSQIYFDIELIYLAIKSQFNLIQTNLDPEAFMICLNFFDWSSDEFKRFKAFLKLKCSQKNTDCFVKTARSLILQLARFIGFLEKVDLIFRI